MAADQVGGAVFLTDHDIAGFVVVTGEERDIGHEGGVAVQRDVQGADVAVQVVFAAEDDGDAVVGGADVIDEDAAGGDRRFAVFIN